MTKVQEAGTVEYIGGGITAGLTFLGLGALLTGSSVSITWNSHIYVSGVNGKPVYRISFCLGRNDRIRKEYLRTGY